MAVVSKARNVLTYRAICSAITKGDQVEYWLMKAYEHLDAGILTDEQVTDIEERAAAYFDAQDAAEAANEDAPVIDVEDAPENGAGD